MGVNHFIILHNLCTNLCKKWVSNISPYHIFLAKICVANGCQAFHHTTYSFQKYMRQMGVNHFIIPHYLCKNMCNKWVSTISSYHIIFPPTCATNGCQPFHHTTYSLQKYVWKMSVNHFIIPHYLYTNLCNKWVSTISSYHIIFTQICATNGCQPFHHTTLSLHKSVQQMGVNHFIIPHNISCVNLCVKWLSSISLYHIFLL